jgi:hypothetical protein
VQREHRQLLLVATVGTDLAALAVQDEAVGAIPVLDNIESVVDLATKCLEVQVPTQKDRLDGFAQLAERLVGRVLRCVAGERTGSLTSGWGLVAKVPRMTSVGTSQPVRVLRPSVSTAPVDGQIMKCERPHNIRHLTRKPSRWAGATISLVSIQKRRSWASGQLALDWPVTR